MKLRDYLNLSESYELDEVTGGGHVDPRSGMYTGRESFSAKKGRLTRQMNRQLGLGAGPVHSEYPRDEPGTSSRMKDTPLAKAMHKVAKLKRSGDVKSMRRGNKIITTMRGLPEELEVILDYLLDEGYCNSYESAAVIYENMSDEWLDVIAEKFKSTGYSDDYDPYTYSRDEYPSRATTRTGRRIQQRVRALSKSSDPKDREKAEFIHKTASDRTSHERGLAKANRNRRRGPGPRRARQDALRDMEQSGY